MLDGAEVVGRILAMTPGLKEVTLYSQEPGETLANGVKWTIKRKNADRELMMMAGAQVGIEHRVFQFLREEQTTMPAVDFTVKDWEGKFWIIRHVDYKMADHVFDCLCLKKV